MSFWKSLSLMACLSLTVALVGCGGGTTEEAPPTDVTVAPDMTTDLSGETAVEEVTATEMPVIEEAPAPLPPAETEAKDIVDTAAANESFSTLVAAVTAAELVETLKSDGPFTVFAPTNDAFAKLPEGTVEDLLKPENKEKLVAVLTYHVVPGKVMAADAIALDGQSATSVQGAGIPIAVVDGKVTVAGATVTTADIACSNGVIHVIDAVILPPEE